MPKKKPFSKAWMERAYSHPELHTKDNESVRSKSNAGPGGKEQLFPMIRARGPGLERLYKPGESSAEDAKSVKRAQREANQRGDAKSFNSVKEATDYSKAFSAALGRQGASPMGKFLASQAPIYQNTLPKREEEAQGKKRRHKKER